jgi:hypothetical protein
MSEVLQRVQGLQHQTYRWLEREASDVLFAELG